MSDSQGTENKDTKDTQAKSKSHPLDDFGAQVEKFASRTADTIKRAVDKALASRNTVLTIRVNDESNRKLNMLVAAGLFKSRSESAAFLIQEGIKRQDALFLKIDDKLKKMEAIKEELQTIVFNEMDKTQTVSEQEIPKKTRATKEKTT